MLVQISIEMLVQFQKIQIADIENFAISAADTLPIRYISTPLLDRPRQSLAAVWHYTQSLISTLSGTRGPVVDPRGLTGSAKSCL